MAERLSATLMENLITVLAYDEKQGRVIANMLDPNLMEGDYRTIAERCIDYWHTYNVQPGDHTADLMSDILEDKHNRRAGSVRRILRGMVALSESINTKYVMDQLRKFGRMQRLKSAIIESADKITAKQEMALDEIEDIWHALLRDNEKDFSAGTRLTDVDHILEQVTSDPEFSFGIEHLDRRGIVPKRGTLTVWLASAGRGKTWALVHTGKMALLNRKKVLHISLEVDEAEIGQRYYQAMFGAAKRDGDVEITEFVSTLGALDGLKRRDVAPEFALQSEIARDEIMGRMEMIGLKRFSNLIIKRFPPHQLTANGIRAFLDTLESSEGFIPDMVILDYLGIMKVDQRNLRTSMGFNVVELRAIAVERNMAFMSAHQSSKEGEKALMVKSIHVAEDWSIVATADQIITYSTTDREFRYGLARLYVAKARTEQDRFAMLITQSYKLGQFCMESHLMDKAYQEHLDELTQFDDDADAEDDDSE